MMGIRPISSPLCSPESMQKVLRKRPEGIQKACGKLPGMHGTGLVGIIPMNSPLCSQEASRKWVLACPE